MKREDLHAYQNHCINFIEGRKDSILILEMGLGKTAITLTAILDLMFDSFDVHKTLIIAPLRVARDVWPEECQMKWEHTKDIQMSVVVGDSRTREAALERGADVYVVNRENIKWLVEFYEKRHEPWPFDMCVIDELSSFKNHKSQRFKYLKKVRPYITRMVGLTGTPSSNGLMDLWAEVGIIDSFTRLGRFIGKYRETYFKPASMNPYTGVVYSYVPIPGAEEEIYDKIGDITVSMKALDYLDMPKKVVVNHEVQMTPSERKIYDQMKKDLVADIDGEEIDAANAAVLTGKLLQMANGALYGSERSVLEIHRHKLEMLEDLIEQSNGQSVLIAYWFQHDRQRIEDHLKTLGIDVREIKSSEDIDQWNRGDIPVALISPASAGHGLNIQHGGHILIWYSMIWSLEMRQQTDARLWRQGQSEVVTIHNIICKDTVDEDVLRALEHKDTTQENLIRAVKAHLGSDGSRQRRKVS